MALRDGGPASPKTKGDATPVLGRAHGLSRATDLLDQRPPEICTLCKEPLGPPDETSSWNGSPAHRDCVRIHLLQRDPAFRDSSDGADPAEESGDSIDGVLPRDDDEADFE